VAFFNFRIIVFTIRALTNGVNNFLKRERAMKVREFLLATTIISTAALSQKTFAILTPASVPNLSIYVSGSSTMDGQFRKLVTNLCDPVSPTNSDKLIYLTTGNEIPDSWQQAFMCRMSPPSSGGKVPGLSSSMIVAVYKRSEGGSGFGVGPVASAKPIDFLNKFTCSATATGSVVENAISHQIFGNCGTARVASDAGISDVEPSMFRGPNLIDPSIPENSDINAGDLGTVILQVADINKLVINSMNVTTYGIPVTLNLYRALQAVQGKDTSRDDVANMPTLSREQVASLMAGSLSGDWANLTVNSGGTNVSLTSHSAVVAGNWQTHNLDKIEICRPSSGSGAQAQYSALFHKSPCSSGGVQPLNDNTEFSGRMKDASSEEDFSNPVWFNIGRIIGYDGVLPTAPAVHESQSAGDVADCLDRLQDNGVWGLGIQSLERGSDKWRFIKLNGVAPTLENVAKNNYFDWAVGTMQWRTVAAGGPASGSPKLAVLAAIKNQASQPPILAAINSGFNSRIKLADGTTNAPVGILALRSSSVSPTAPFGISNPVMTAVREKGGNSDSCGIAKMIAKSGQKTELDINIAD